MGKLVVSWCFFGILFSGGGYLLTGLFLKSFFAYLSRNILIKNEYDIDMCALAMVSSRGAYVSGIAQRRMKHMGGIKTKPVQ